MGQPIKIYRKQKTAVVYGQAQLAVMVADGWTQEPEQKTAVDDLTRINGIGDKKADELNALGIFSFAGLATIEPAFLREKTSGLNVEEVIDAAKKLADDGVTEETGEPADGDTD